MITKRKKILLMIIIPLVVFVVIDLTIIPIIPLEFVIYYYILNYETTSFYSECNSIGIGCGKQESTFTINGICQDKTSKYTRIYEGNTGSTFHSEPTVETNSVTWIKCTSLFHIDEPYHDQYCLIQYKANVFCAELPAVEKWYQENKHRCDDSRCYIINDRNKYYKDLSPSNNHNKHSYYDMDIPTSYFDNNDIPKLLPRTIQVDMPFHTPKWQENIQLTIKNVSIDNNLQKHEFHIYDRWDNRFNIPFEPNENDTYDITLNVKEHNIHIKRDDVPGHRSSTLEIHVTYNNQYGVGLSFILV